MKNTLAVVSLVAFFCTSYAMYTEKSLLLKSNNTKNTFAYVSRKIDKRVTAIHDNCSYPKSFEGDVERLEGQYKKLLKEDESQVIQWPADQLDYRPISVNISNQHLTTLQTLEGDTIVSVFYKAPAHVDCSFLTKIDVSGNKLTVLPLTYIMDACPKLLELIASHNAIEHVSFFRRGSGWHVRSNYVSSNGTLKRLDLSHNQLSYFSLESLFNHYPIESVDLSNNPLEKVTLFNGRFLSESYPSIDMRNTCLSQEQKQELREKYLNRAQSNISFIINAVTFFSGVSTATTVGVLLAETNPYISTIGFFGAVVGSGLGSSTISRLFAYGRAFSRLSTIENDVKDQIIFEDRDIKEELEI